MMLYRTCYFLNFIHLIYVYKLMEKSITIHHALAKSEEK